MLLNVFILAYPNLINVKSIFAFWANMFVVRVKKSFPLNLIIAMRAFGCVIHIIAIYCVTINCSE